jgi:hypothetical protein
MLLAAWRKHLAIHGVEQEPRGRNEGPEEYLRRVQPHWGIVEMVKWSADRFGGADVVLIEAKASGLARGTLPGLRVKSVVQLFALGGV